MKKGFYVIFEGCHGTGKTTQSKKLVEFLQKKFPAKEVIWTREPGGSEIAESIRKLVQGTNFSEEMDYICEAYLYAASRAHTLRKIVKPVLNKSGIVIQDNSVITGLAYQGVARKLGFETLLEINRFALGDILPDLVIHMSLDLQKTRERTSDTQGDKFERLGIEFDRKVEAGYKKASKLPMFKGKWINVNAEGDISDVFNKILKKIS